MSKMINHRYAAADRDIGFAPHAEPKARTVDSLTYHVTLGAATVSSSLGLA